MKSLDDNNTKTQSQTNNVQASANNANASGLSLMSSRTEGGALLCCMDGGGRLCGLWSPVPLWWGCKESQRNREEASEFKFGREVEVVMDVVDVLMQGWEGNGWKNWGMRERESCESLHFHDGNDHGLDGEAVAVDAAAVAAAAGHHCESR